MDLTKIQKCQAYKPEEINQLFEKYNASEVGSRYNCTSGYEFGMMLHSMLMCYEGPTKGRETFQVDKCLKRAVPHPATIYYERIVYNDNLGLIVNGVRMATALELIKTYGNNITRLREHFEALDGSAIYHVSVTELIRELEVLFERESKYAAHHEALMKAFEKVISNMDGDESVTIKRIDGKISIYK